MNYKEILESYPLSIASEEYRYLGFQQNKEDCDATIKKLELDITQIIETKAEQEEFKKELSNATKRASAVQKELKDNTAYQELLAESKSLGLTLKKLEIDICRMKREFRSAECLAVLK